MVELMLLTLRVRFTVTANRLINFLGRIPLVKKIIRPELYGDYSLKMVFMAIGVIFVSIKKIFGRLFYAGFLVVFGLAIYQAAQLGGYPELFDAIRADDMAFAPTYAPQVARYVLTAWFTFSFVGSFAGSAVATHQSHYNDMTMINYLRTDPALYAKAKLALNATADILMYLPLVVVCFAVARLPIWFVFPMLLMFATFRLIGLAINLLVFRFTRRHLSRWPYSLISFLVLFAAAYFPVYFGIIDWMTLFSSPLVPILSVAVGLLAWMYIDRYDRHRTLTQDNLAYMEQALSKAIETNKRAERIDTAKWHKNVETTALQFDKHKDKSGFDYLNAVFFDRHGKFFRGKMMRRCLFILAPLLLASGLTIYDVIFNANESGRQWGSIPFNFAPMFFFIMYIASMGRVVTATVFNNCDMHMLHYTYYRTAETTVASFKSRFAVILRYNMIISAVTAFSVLGSVWLLFGYMDFLSAGVFCVLLLLIGLFFAFNDLFLYYVIQPYDSAGQSKSMPYKVINFVIYMVAYMNFQIRLDLIGYTVAVAIVTVLYLGIGTLLLAKIAPKKFKLR